MAKKPYNQRKLTEFALKMAGDIAATIAVPVSTLVFIAKKAEAALETRKPALVGLAIIVSFLVTTVAVSKKALKYGDIYVDMTDEADDEDRAGPPTDPASRR